MFKLKLQTVIVAFSFFLFGSLTLNFLGFKKALANPIQSPVPTLDLALDTKPIPTATPTPLLTHSCHVIPKPIPTLSSIPSLKLSLLNNLKVLPSPTPSPSLNLKVEAHPYPSQTPSPLRSESIPTPPTHLGLIPATTISPTSEAGESHSIPTLQQIFSTSSSHSPQLTPKNGILKKPTIENEVPLEYSRASAIHPEEVAPRISLAQIILNDLLGIKFEPTGANEKLQDDAKKYAKIRHSVFRYRMKSIYERSCKDSQNLDPFCKVVQEQNRKGIFSEERSSRFTRLSFVKNHFSRYQIRRWIQAGKLEFLVKVNDSNLKEALKGISSPAELELLANTLSLSSSCENKILALNLGTKFEEFLPEHKARDLSVALYQKAASCGDNEYSDRARFRLSLLEIWKGNYKQALPHLEFLINRSTLTDYRSRSLYWQMICAEKLGDNTLAAQAKKNLHDRFPFSMHTILLQKEGNTQILPISWKHDSSIQFRTTQPGSINDRIRAIEGLISIRETMLAREILDKMEPDLQTTEPEFRMYTAVLCQRLGLHVNHFKLMSSSFRDQPTLISKTALELYYPHSLFDAHPLNSTEVDPNLMLSLIRQESAFNERARSPAGALGLMQIMPHTAQRFERIRRRDRLYDPLLNMRIGSKYFSELLKYYNRDAELALAAYNAGPKRVDEWLKRYPVKDRILFLDLIPFKETREYVASIARNYFWYVSLYSNPQSEMGEMKTEVRIERKRFGNVFKFLNGT